MKLSLKEIELLIAVIKPWHPSEDWTDTECEDVQKLLNRIYKEHDRALAKEEESSN